MMRSSSLPEETTSSYVSNFLEATYPFLAIGAIIIVAAIIIGILLYIFIKRRSGRGRDTRNAPLVRKILASSISKSRGKIKHSKRQDGLTSDLPDTFGVNMEGSKEKLKKHDQHSDAHSRKDSRGHTKRKEDEKTYWKDRESNKPSHRAKEENFETASLRGEVGRVQSEQEIKVGISETEKKRDQIFYGTPTTIPKGMPPKVGRSLSSSATALNVASRDAIPVRSSSFEMYKTLTPEKIRLFKEFKEQKISKSHIAPMVRAYLKAPPHYLSIQQTSGGLKATFIPFEPPNESTLKQHTKAALEPIQERTEPNMSSLSMSAGHSSTGGSHPMSLCSMPFKVAHNVPAHGRSGTSLMPTVVITVRQPYSEVPAEGSQIIESPPNSNGQTGIADHPAPD